MLTKNWDFCEAEFFRSASKKIDFVDKCVFCGFVKYNVYLIDA